jgi:hypothetical protein
LLEIKEQIGRALWMTMYQGVPEEGVQDELA